MKATIVLIADTAGENFGRQVMLDAHKAGNLGFEMARLPQHVSLKQPFVIQGLAEMEQFFDEFARGWQPVEIHFDRLNIYPNSALGGVPSGCMSIEVKATKELQDMQRELFKRLEERFGDCPAEHDDDYVFHMTVAIGGAPYENYQAAYEALAERDFAQSFVFDRMGLLYYDDDRIRPGTYFCYKVADLR